MTTKPTDWDVSFRETLISLDVGESEPYTAACYEVVAQGPDGARFVHGHAFPGARVVTDDEGFSWAKDIRAEAETEAVNLMSRVRAAQVSGLWPGPAENPHWHEAHPAYGSPAYQALSFTHEEES